MPRTSTILRNSSSTSREARGPCKHLIDSSVRSAVRARRAPRRSGPRATRGGYVHLMEHSDASCDTMTTAHSEEDDMHGIPPQPDCGSGPKSRSLLSSPPSRTTNLRRRCDGEPPPTTVNHGDWTHDMRPRPEAIPGHIAMSEPLSGLRADTGNRTRVFSLGS